MRPTPSTTNATNAAATTTAGFHRWNSPMPYLFSGLALMLGLITLALVILACSHRKTSNSDQSQSETADQEKSVKSVHVMKPEMEPKIVVIMAGDEIPTYLANPLSSTHHCEAV